MWIAACAAMFPAAPDLEANRILWAGAAVKARPARMSDPERRTPFRRRGSPGAHGWACRTGGANTGGTPDGPAAIPLANLPWGSGAVGQPQISITRQSCHYLARKGRKSLATRQTLG